MKRNEIIETLKQNRTAYLIIHHLRASCTACARVTVFESDYGDTYKAIHRVVRIDTARKIKSAIIEGMLPDLECRVERNTSTIRAKL